MAKWEYAELLVLEDRVLVVYSAFDTPATQFSCSAWSDPAAVAAGTENPVGFKVPPDRGPLMEAPSYLGALGWELVNVVAVEGPIAMYFKRQAG